MIRVRELRIAKGIQQKELAIDLGVTQPTVSDWESGRKIPSAKSTQKLADYFGVSIDYLLGRNEKEKPTPIPEGEPLLPPEYEFLNPTNKAIVDRLIADLVKGQPPEGPASLSYAARKSDEPHTSTGPDTDVEI